MAKAKQPIKKQEIYRKPGQEQFALFLRENPDLFNLSAFERVCEFPIATLRHVRTGSRPLTLDQYKKLQQVMLPKLTEMVFLLQNYEGKIEQRSYNSRWNDDDDDY